MSIETFFLFMQIASIYAFLPDIAFPNFLSCIRIKNKSSTKVYAGIWQVIGQNLIEKSKVRNKDARALISKHTLHSMTILHAVLQTLV